MDRDGLGTEGAAGKRNPLKSSRQEQEEEEDEDEEEQVRDEVRLNP